MVSCFRSRGQQAGPKDGAIQHQEVDDEEEGDDEGGQSESSEDQHFVMHPPKLKFIALTVHNMTGRTWFV